MQINVVKKEVVGVSLNVVRWDADEGGPERIIGQNQFPDLDTLLGMLEREHAGSRSWPIRFEGFAS